MISKADISDIVYVAKLMENFYTEEGYVFDKTNVIKCLNQFISNSTLGSIFLLTYNKEIAGYVIVANSFCFELGGRIGYVDELFVLKQHRGKLLGSKLLSHVIALYTKENYAALRLEVEHSHLRVAELYKRIGFFRHDRALMSLSLKNPSQT